MNESTRGQGLRQPRCRTAHLGMGRAGAGRGRARKQGTMHSKFAVFDAERSLVGSYNLDPRSEKLNSEIGRSCSCSRSWRAQLRSKLLDEDLRYAREITPEQAAGFEAPGQRDRAIPQVARRAVRGAPLMSGGMDHRARRALHPGAAGAGDWPAARRASCRTGPTGHARTSLRDVQSKTIGDVTVSVSILTDEQAAAALRRRLRRARTAGAVDERAQRLRPPAVVHPQRARSRTSTRPTKRRCWCRATCRSDSATGLAPVPPRRVDPRAAAAAHHHGGLRVPAAGRGRSLRRHPPAGRRVRRGQPTHGRSPAARPSDRTPRELRFDFALPLPDGDFDYERLDPAQDLRRRSRCPT